MPSTASPPRRPARLAWIYSIAGRLALWYFLSAACLLAFSTWYLYWGLERGVYVSDERRLTDKLERLRVQFGETSFSEEAMRAEVAREAEAREYYRGYIRILAAPGKIIAQSPDMNQMLVRRLVADEQHPSADPPELSVVKLANGRSYLLLTTWLQSQLPGRSPVIQLALDRSPEEALLSTYRDDAIVILVAGLLASMLVGMFLARRALRPLDQFTQVARAVRVTHLHPRVADEDWPKELAELAQTFDQMLDRLEESFQRLSQFSADIAHELRTPLNILRGEAEVALSKARSPDEYRAVLESSMEEYDRLGRMMESLLFLARSDNAVLQLERKRIPLQDELAAICEFFDPVAAEQQVTLSYSGTGEVMADPILFRRAVVNLVSNALRHTPAGGVVNLEASRSDDRAVLIRVVDTGSGIPAEHLSKLFDRFYRVDSARTRNGQSGTGLGLAIVKSIMHRHGGSVTVQSEFGKGSTVTLRFPAHPERADSIAAR